MLRTFALPALCLVGFSMAGCDLGRDDKPAAVVAPPPPPASAWTSEDSRVETAQLVAALVKAPWVGAFHERTGQDAVIAIGSFTDRAHGDIDLADLRQHFASALGAVPHLVVAPGTGDASPAAAVPAPSRPAAAVPAAAPAASPSPAAPAASHAPPTPPTPPTPPAGASVAAAHPADYLLKGSVGEQIDAQQTPPVHYYQIDVTVVDARNGAPVSQASIERAKHDRDPASEAATPAGATATRPASAAAY
jgi:hypothetical protein